jgi:hypothetical protein
VGVVEEGYKRKYLENHRKVHSRIARHSNSHGCCHKPLYDILPDCSNNRELQQGVLKPQELEVPLSQQDPL